MLFSTGKTQALVPLAACLRGPHDPTPDGRGASRTPSSRSLVGQRGRCSRPQTEDESYFGLNSTFTEAAGATGSYPHARGRKGREPSLGTQGPPFLG